MQLWLIENSGLFKMTTPFFTIIIPSFNTALTISGCIDTIVNQSFQDFEILIVDGLSSDKTIAVVKDYAAKYHNIRFVSEPDKGIYDAMNKGIHLAKGKWIYFIGSDDKLYDDAVLKNVADAIEKVQGVEIIYGNVFSERFNGLYDGEFNISKILEKNISHQAIFFDKNVFNKTGYFDLKYRAQSDWDHNLKWILSDNIKKKYLPITIAFYADGGFSSLHGDEVFNKDLRTNYLSYGKNTLPFNKKLQVLVHELLKSIKRMDFERAKRALQYF